MRISQKIGTADVEITISEGGLSAWYRRAPQSVGVGSETISGPAIIVVNEDGVLILQGSKPVPEQDLYCKPVFVPTDVELLDAPSALQADSASGVDGEGEG